MSAISLRQLEIFAQVVEHGSFRGCARHIGVSQVAISDHVRALEAALGQRLFERTAGGPARLTLEGERAYRRVVDILSDVGDLVWDLDPSRGRLRRLTVAVPPFLMDRLREPIEAFSKAHPELDLSVDLEPAEPADLHRRVRDRTLDLGYFFSFDGREAPGSEVIRHEPIAVFVGCDHALARRSTVNVRELRSVPAVHLTSHNPLRAPIDRVFEQIGLAGGAVGLETEDYGLILSSVRRGVGFVCMFRAVEADGLQSEGLKRLELDGALPSLQVRQIARHSSHRDPVLSELRQRLSEVLYG
jgi:molybdate transport repressor ModE-like protein